jgi:hypothetical protein
MILTDAHHGLFGEYLRWIAHKELALGEARPDLWASAVAQSRGDEGRARDIYLESRARSLHVEAAVAERFLRLLHQSEDSAVQVRNAVVFLLARPAGARAESPG